MIPALITDPLQFAEALCDDCRRRMLHLIRASRGDITKMPGFRCCDACDSKVAAFSKDIAQ